MIEELARFEGCFVAARVEMSAGPCLQVMSVHSPAWPVDRERLKNIDTTSGFRSGLVIVDDKGFIFTPTPLYLEAEPNGIAANNALRLSKEQVAEALARLSPAANGIAVAKANNPDEKTRISSLPDEVGSIQVSDSNFARVDESLKQAPPVQFDIVRQVRVFEAYLQYVELSLTGVAIQRRKFILPTSLQEIGSSTDLNGRLRTTYDLIDKDDEISSKPFEDELNEIRKNFTPSLGKDHGRVVLKSVKPILMERLEQLRKKLEKHQKNFESKLQKQLDHSRNLIIDYYLPLVIERPPDNLRGQSPGGKPSKETVKRWLQLELKKGFPKAPSVVNKIILQARFKDITFETLNQLDFLEAVKKAFPTIDWEKTYKEFKAAGQTESAMMRN